MSILFSIEVHGNTVDLTLKEAKELRDMLVSALGDTYPYPPAVPYTVPPPYPPYYVGDCPTDSVTTCGK